MSVMSVSARATRIAVGATLLGAGAAVRAGRSAGDAVAGAITSSSDEIRSALGTSAAMVAEAIGATPARRVTETPDTRWIEVRGLDSDFDAVSAAVHESLTDLPGVTDVHVNGPLSRVIVSVAAGGPSATELAAVVAEAERRALPGAQPRPTALPSLPGDATVLAADLVGTGVSGMFLAASVVTTVFPVVRLSQVVAAPITVANFHPRVRGALEHRLGDEGAELLLSTLQAAAAAATASPTSALVTTCAQAIRTIETLNGLRAWQRVEPRLAAHARKFDQIPTPSVRPSRPTENSGRPREEIAMDAGLAGAAILAVAADLMTAAKAAVVAAPRPARSVRETFGASVGRGLHQREGALVMNPRALRRLDEVDTLLVDPRVLFTNELAVTRVVGVDDSARSAAWQRATAALADGRLSPGWNRLADITGDGGHDPDADPAARVLVSHLRRPLATALLAEARQAGVRVVGIHDEGLHSLLQGFDEIMPVADDLEASLASCAQQLHDDGATLALLTVSGDNAIEIADLSIGMVGDDAALPWHADILIPDLTAAWRIVHALPAARDASFRGTALATGASLLGALMLIPGVPGDGPTSVAASALYGFWAGFGSGYRVFTDPVPLPESGHDWYSMPLDEVRRLLPRPVRVPEPSGPIEVAASSPAIRFARQTALRAWGLGSDFLHTMSEELDDPITPILATGAAASALLGSPLDAAMVGGVLVLNTAISAQQSLHAERLLDRMLARQEPLARRMIDITDPDGPDGYDEVESSLLRPGDVIEVRSGEVVPADGRILDADTVEVDESALTGESLPVGKNTADTPGAPLAERTGMIFAGTTVVAGKVRAIVTAAGPATQVSRALALSPREVRTVGLAAQLGEITKRALPWSLTGGALVGVLSLLRGTPIRKTASETVGISVAAVPEGLPLVVTLAQSASARDLTGSSVLVRNARAIEAFARLDTVCFDKTGTLSENRLRVRAISPATGADDDAVLTAAGATMLVTRSGTVEHATDAAIHRAAVAAGLGYPELDAFLPFQSNRPFAAALSGRRLMVKGAPEALMAAVEPGQRAELTETLHRMAIDGLRVLTVAERVLTAEQAAAASADPDLMAELCASSLHLLGAIGMSDTLRPGAAPLLAELASRGIEVRLITGDHPVTAAVVARDLGLAVGTDQVMTGTAWDELDGDGRIAAVRTHQVFARMSPEHKVQVVQALESAGLVTAMVGDGANDAAAIRAAAVGVGVVSEGSDPARMAADVMLLDGDIAAMIPALDEGEQLWRRVQSAVSVLLGHNVGEVSFALITTLLSGSPALNARQMLLVNMLTDALPAAALAVSPQRDPDVHGRHDESTIWRAVAVRGVFTTLGATLAWTFGRLSGRAARASTIGLVGLVVTQMMETLMDSHGPLVVATNVGTFVVMAGIISIPGVSQVFGCTPIGPVGWAQAFAAAFIAAGVATTMPGVIDRLAGGLPGSVLDGEDPDADEHGVEVLERGSDESDARVDESLGSERAGDLRHGR